MVGLAVLSFLLLVAATGLLAFHRYVWDAFLLLILSGCGLLLSLTRTVTPPKNFSARPARFLPRTLTGWVRLSALLVVVVVSFSARRDVAGRDYTALFLGWLIAVLSFGATLLLPLIRRKRTETLCRSERYALAGLLLAAFLVRALALGQIPANLGGDEGTQLLAGLRLVERPLGNPFATGWYSVPTMSFLAYGVAMRLFGATMAGGRMLSAIVGTVTVLTTFLLGRTLGGRRVGWVAALVVAFSHYHIHFSRLASNQIFDPLIGTLSLWLLWLALKPVRPVGNAAGEGQFQSSFQDEMRTVSLWGLSGLVAGMGWYTYFGARWVTFLIGLIVAWRMLVEPRFWVRHRRGLLMFAGGWLMVVLPLLGWYTVHPSALTERYNEVSIFASGWLEREVTVTGKPPLTLLLCQLWKAATAFHYTPDPTFWYFPQAPLLDFITGALVLVGLMVALRRARWPSRAVTLIWLGSTLLMAWGLTENPPSSQRGLLLVPAVALLAAWGMEALWKVLGSVRLARVTFGILLSLMALYNLGFYFAVYTPRRLYGNPTAEIATALAHYILKNPHPVCGSAGVEPCYSTVYFFGAPVIYWQFGGMAFLLRDQPGMDVLPGEMPAHVASPARFVFTGGRFNEFDAVQSAYPGGVAAEVKSPDGHVLALIYDWSAASSP
ncbi:MAG TPA: glycosyltransferase family 39 protein [Anaerolineae bacterium]|nr:glycosyltransferase family 39 protein [Anaerolineae bacterium]HQH37610.1 glycosyltransferase family 39 protein [Anaerolineae bacterium]